MSDQVSVFRIILMAVVSRSHINILDQVSVLAIVLMPVCRSEINKTKSDLGVRSGISVKNHVNVSVK